MNNNNNYNCSRFFKSLNEYGIAPEKPLLFNFL